jgi:RHS repeat-associated protein
MTYDGTHSYAWDVEGKMITVDTTTLTHDALGRLVEKNVGGTITEFVYGPMGGKFAKAFVPLPTGTAVYTGSGLAYYRHGDHLGSSRLATTPTRTMYSSTAYAPFGEPYAQAGTTDLSFAGHDQDTVAGIHDALFREYPAVQGRWLTPDPAGTAAVDPTNPQSWNRYAYVMNNPSNWIDLVGLDVCYAPDGNDLGCFDGGSGFGGGGGNLAISGLSGDPFQLTGVSWNYIAHGVTYIGVNDNQEFTYLAGNGDWELSAFFAFRGFSNADTSEVVAANNVAPQPTKTQERLERLKNCALGYYGIDPLSISGGTSNGAKWGLIVLSAGGIPKSVAAKMGLRVIMQPGASEYTSAFSMLSLATGGGGALRTVANFGSKWVLPIAIASAVIDATAIGICTALELKEEVLG